tara:strand:- start:56 stop:334 length:279 start_codon:yes stop_codon:yes gene_type:complete
MSEIEELKFYIEIYPNFDEYYYRRGIEKYKLEDYQGAIDDFTEAIKRDPYNEVYYEQRSIVKKQLGNNIGAGKDNKKAERLKYGCWFEKQKK